MTPEERQLFGEMGVALRRCQTAMNALPANLEEIPASYWADLYTASVHARQMLEKVKEFDDTTPGPRV